MKYISVTEVELSNSVLSGNGEYRVLQVVKPLNTPRFKVMQSLIKLILVSETFDETNHSDGQRKLLSRSALWRPISGFKFLDYSHFLCN
jgi:hypothetical protein